VGFWRWPETSQEAVDRLLWEKPAPQIAPEEDDLKSLRERQEKRQKSLRERREKLQKLLDRYPDGLPHQMEEVRRRIGNIDAILADPTESGPGRKEDPIVQMGQNPEDPT